MIHFCFVCLRRFVFGGVVVDHRRWSSEWQSKQLQQALQIEGSGGQGIWGIREALQIYGGIRKLRRLSPAAEPMRNPGGFVWGCRGNREALQIWVSGGSAIGEFGRFCIFNASAVGQPGNPGDFADSRVWRRSHRGIRKALPI